MTKVGNNGKPFNETVTAFFDSPNWAGKAYKGEENSAYLSADLNEEAVSVLKKLKPGNKLLLRKSGKLNSQGGFTFFMEVIPPKGENRTATQEIEEGI